MYEFAEGLKLLFFWQNIKFAMGSTEETWIALKNPKKPTHCFKIPSPKQ